MTVIRKKHIDKSYEVYLALYQGLTNYNEDKDAYRQFSFDKTITFFVDIEHAQRMRAAIANANPDLVIQDSRYVM